jgi:hypothetical protein
MWFTRFYLGLSLRNRLFLGIGAAVVLNAIYCLIYRYASGNPATLFEAFSWGIINIAPWVAAFEIGRCLRRFSIVAVLFLVAGTASIALEAVLYIEWPTAFDFVRRIPAALLVAIALGVLAYDRTRPAMKRVDSFGAASETLNPDFANYGCDWATSAGNYVEVHCIGKPLRLKRSSLAQFISSAGPRLVRVHRRFAVCPRSVSRIERTNIVLVDGTRIPLGNRYRAQVIDGDSLVPSSQST